MRTLTIVTPDQVAFHLTAAGIGTRAAAWLTDQAILLAVRAAALIGFFSAGIGDSPFIIPAFVMLDLVYFAYFEWRRNGQTPGKARFGLRVINTSGVRLSLEDVLIRNIVRILDSLPVCMLVGGVCSFLDPLARRFGDLAAGTMVVLEKSAAYAPPARDRNQPNTFRDIPIIRRRILARAGKEDRDLAIELLWRRDWLEPETRERLFGLAAERYRKRFSLPEESHLSDEQTVVNIALLLGDDRG